MPKFRPERLVYGGSLAEGDEPEPYRWQIVGALIFLAVFGVVTAALAQDAPIPPPDPKVDAIRAELSDRARAACMNDLATIVAQRNDALTKVAALQKELDGLKKGPEMPAPPASKPPEHPK